jgi:hypothetical protein
VADAQRHRQGVEHPLGGVGRLLDVLDVLEQQCELVPAESRGGVACAHARGEAHRHGREHLVAGGVTEAVVDGLEVVQIQEDHGNAALLAPAPGDRMAHALGEERAVREAGNGIVESLVGELLLERKALADVAAVEHDAAHVLVAEQVGAVDLELLRCAVPVHQRALDDVRLVARERGVAREHLPHAAAVGRMHQLVEGPPGHLLGRVPEQPLDRGALVRDPAVGSDHGDQVARVTDERAEAGFAATPVHLLGQRGALQRERHLCGQRPQRRADRLGRRGAPGDDE